MHIKTFNFVFLFLPQILRTYIELSWQSHIIVIGDQSKGISNFIPSYNLKENRVKQKTGKRNFVSIHVSMSVFFHIWTC